MLGVLGSIADHRRLSRAASTVESAINTADRRWVADLYAATGTVEVSVVVEFATWRSAPWRTDKSGRRQQLHTRRPHPGGRR